MTDGEKIDEQAAQWVAREDRGLSIPEKAAFESWVSASTANRLAYLRLGASWERTIRLAALRHAPQFSEPPARGRLFWSVMTATALVLVSLSVVATMEFRRPVPPTVYATGAANRPILRLADGSQIQLNSNTRLQTNLSGSTRAVTLEQGEAYFEVVHEDGRPFVVTAGNHRITDLGTKFSVRRDGDDVRVLVTEGKVRVDVINPVAQTAPVTASGGEVVMAKADGAIVASRSAQDISDELSWRSELLTFNETTLADAAEQFNHYNSRHIVVRGPARSLRIGGSFRSDNLDAFALLVRNALRLKVASDAREITISQ